MKKTDITNKRFGRLVAIKRTSTSPTKWLCRCDCGKETEVYLANLIRGHTTSCGCRRREQSPINAIKHGLSGERIYRIWHGMKSRCKREKNKDYANYGGRGIKLDPRWESFENFLEDMGLPPTEDHTIDRIDIDGDYTKENCQWLPSKENAEKRRDTIWITYNGEKHSLNYWHRKTGLHRSTIEWRINKGWTPEEALTIPPMRRGPRRQIPFSPSPLYPSNSRRLEKDHTP